MNRAENNAQAAAAQQMRQQVMNAPDASCGKCGGEYFENVFKVKKVSAIVSPNAQETIVPIQTLRCLKCGNILNDLSDFASESPEEQVSETVANAAAPKK